VSTIEISDDVIRPRDEAGLKYLVARNLILLACAGFWCAIAALLMRVL